MRFQHRMKCISCCTTNALNKYIINIKFANICELNCAKFQYAYKMRLSAKTIRISNAISIWNWVRLTHNFFLKLYLSRSLCVRKTTCRNIKIVLTLVNMRILMLCKCASMIVCLFNSTKVPTLRWINIRL